MAGRLFNFRINDKDKQKLISEYAVILKTTEADFIRRLLIIHDALHRSSPKDCFLCGERG